MRKFNIIYSVLLFTCSTVLLTGIPLMVDLDTFQSITLALITVLGYAASYLMFDTYVDMTKAQAKKDATKHYSKIWDDAFDEGYKQGWLEYKKTNGGQLSEAEHIKTFNNLNKLFEDGKDINKEIL